MLLSAYDRMSSIILTSAPEVECPDGQKDWGQGWGARLSAHRLHRRLDRGLTKPARAHRLTRMGGG
jgi:hypothetical protein